MGSGGCGTSGGGGGGNTNCDIETASEKAVPRRAVVINIGFPRYRITRRTPIDDAAIKKALVAYIFDSK